MCDHLNHVEVKWPNYKCLECGFEEKLQGFGYRTKRDKVICEITLDDKKK